MVSIIYFSSETAFICSFLIELLQSILFLDFETLGMENKTAIFILWLCICIPVLLWIWTDGYRKKKRRERDKFTEREVRERFSSWFYIQPEGTNIDEGLERYITRYYSTFKRQDDEDDECFDLRIRISLLRESVGEWYYPDYNTLTNNGTPTMFKDIELEEGIQNLILSYSGTLGMVQRSLKIKAKHEELKKRIKNSREDSSS
jgi:hypothetical protein